MQREGNDVTVIGMGSILKDVCETADSLRERGIGVRVINMHTVKPIDREAIIKAVEETGKVITVEDHSVIGGLGSAVAEVVAEYGEKVKFRRIGLIEFSKGYGNYLQVKAANGIGSDTIGEMIMQLL